MTVDRGLLRVEPGVEIGGDIRAADGAGQLGDATGGQRLLRDGVDPEDAVVIAFAARRVVHAAGIAGPAVAGAIATGDHVDAVRREGGCVLEIGVVFLEILLVLQQPADAGKVAGVAKVLELDPGEERRIVPVADDERRFHVAVHGDVKILKALDARKHVGAVAAKQRHETRVPNPDAVEVGRLVEIGRLRRARAGDDVVPGELPRLPVEVDETRLGGQHRHRQTVAGKGSDRMHDRLGGTQQPG